MRAAWAALARSVGERLAMAVGLIVLGGAHASQAAEESVPEANLDFRSIASWAHHNRQGSAFWLKHTYNYQEIDTAGRVGNGVLDSETSRRSDVPAGVGAYLRWQGHIDFVPIWAQVQAQSLSGRTDYNGFIQNGGALIPYNAETHNHWSSRAVRFGVPVVLNQVFGLPIQVQIIPTVQWQQGRWQRKLVQYSESYRYTFRWYGLLTQWRPWPTAAPDFYLHASWQGVFNDQDLHVEVPSLGFSSRQAAQRMTHTEFGLNYQVMRNFGVQVSVQAIKNRWAAGPIVSGLQAPPSRTVATHLQLGVAFYF